MISLFRVNEWWLFKLAPVLGTAYGSCLVLNQSLISLSTTFLFILVALVVGGSYAQ